MSLAKLLSGGSVATPTSLLPGIGGFIKPATETEGKFGFKKNDVEVLVELQENLGQLNQAAFDEALERSDTTLLKDSSVPIITIFTRTFPTCKISSLKTLKGTPMATHIKEGGVFWLDIVNYDQYLVKTMAKIFGMHPLSAADVLLDEKLEKCECFEDSLFLCLYFYLGQSSDSASSSHRNFPIGTLEIFSTEKYVITFRNKDLPQSNIHFVYNRLVQLTKLELHPSWILYMLLDHAVDGFLPVAEKISFETNSIDQLVLVLPQEEQTDMLTRIGNARKKVSELQEIVETKDDIFKTLLTKGIRTEKRLLLESTLIYLEDVASHNTSIEKNLEAFYTNINNAHTNYLAKISFELSQISFKIGITMNKFSCGACIFLPMTLIAGAMGLNARVPFDLNNPNVTYQYFGYIMLMFVVIAVVGIWLGRRWKIW